MVTLIVPCYNETQRLNIEAFASASEHRFLFVDDGSKDGTADFIAQKLLGYAHCRLVRTPQNGGKAAAVRYGMTEIQKMDWFQTSEWIGFWDADLATPLQEIPLFLKYAQINRTCDSIWGSRVYRLGSHIKRSTLRHYLGRGFATIVHRLLKVEAYDTQCGAKLFRPAVVSKAFGEPFISRWIFDVEILLRLGQDKVIEYPLTRWEDIPGSKVKVIREIFKVFREILKIRERYYDAISR